MFPFPNLLQKNIYVLYIITKSPNNNNYYHFIIDRNENVSSILQFFLQNNTLKKFNQLVFNNLAKIELKSSFKI